KVNAAGGLQCHPIRYVVLDDGGNPSTGLAQVRKLVEEEKAIALVYMDAVISGAGTVNYINQHRIPVIGSEGTSPWFYDSPYFFPQASNGDNYNAGAFGMIKYFAERHGLKKLATVTCVEVALCSGFYSIAPEQAGRRGVEVVYRGQATLVQPDYTSHCLAAKNAGADMLFVGLESNSIDRIVKSCNS